MVKQPIFVNQMQLTIKNLSGSVRDPARGAIGYTGRDMLTVPYSVTGRHAVLEQCYGGAWFCLADA